MKPPGECAGVEHRRNRDGIQWEVRNHRHLIPQQPADRSHDPGLIGRSVGILLRENRKVDSQELESRADETIKFGVGWVVHDVRISGRGEETLPQVSLGCACRGAASYRIGLTRDTTDPFTRTSPGMFAPLVALLIAAQGPAMAPAPGLSTGADVRTVEVSRVTSDSLRLAAFDTAWVRIRDTHYDPDLGGLDWDAIRAEFRPRVEAATSSADFHRIMDEMLDRLGESHFVLIPATAADPSTAAAGRGDPGMRVRWIDGAALVTSVEPGGGAARAGLRPGYEVRTVGDQDLADLVAGLELAGDDAAALWIDAVLAARIRGIPGETLSLRILDADGRVRQKEVALDEPAGELVQFGLLPPFRLEVDDREIHPGGPDGPRIGLIRFNGWFPSAAPLLAEAVDRHRGADGIVLDLRGNPGGVGGLAMGVAGHFLDERLDLGEMRTRDTTLRFVVNPQRIGPDGSRVQPFDGPLVLLVDGLSASTSEIFAGGLKALDRAHLVGETTAGQALPAHLAVLATGDRLMHAVADFTASDGSRLEGAGVRPHTPVHLSRELLLAEADPFLNRALEWITAQRRLLLETSP
ncbi:MAG: hypothetical protein EA422_07755 [Gemmatimonadales bacterium]|nr:MAG: hypothetical protein EA422_07755 [Gemmatimonadales bacterium]